MYVCILDIHTVHYYRIDLHCWPISLCRPIAAGSCIEPAVILASSLSVPINAGSSHEPKVILGHHCRFLASGSVLSLPVWDMT
jgi:hypothetical protein